MEQKLDAAGLDALKILCAQFRIPRESWPGVEPIRIAVETMAVLTTAEARLKDYPERGRAERAQALGEACDELLVDREAFRERRDRDANGAYGWLRYDADADRYGTDASAAGAR